MRRMVPLFVAIPMLFGLALASAGGDEAGAILDKAIKAHGLKGKADQTPGYRAKNKGTIHVANLDLEFSQDISVQVPDKFKEVMEMTVMGNKVMVTTVFNGKEGWIKANNMDVPVKDELLAEFKEVAYSMTLAQGLFLKDKAIKLGLLGEVQVKGKPAVGLRVSKEGHKELAFYFDKGTGLMAKMERRARDFMSGQEVTEERIITEYQDLKGRKIAKKAEIMRDGKLFLEVEVVEAQFVDKLGDAEFAKPE